MMEIAIFKEVTTESALIELEAEGKKYDGLYVDMDKAPERKYVKDKAAFIAGLLKKLDRTRIFLYKLTSCVYLNYSTFNQYVLHVSN